MSLLDNRLLSIAISENNTVNERIRFAYKLDKPPIIKWIFEDGVQFETDAEAINCGQKNETHALACIKASTKDMKYR